MRLRLIVETVERQSLDLAGRLGLEPEVVLAMARAVSGKFWKWVLSQWHSNNIRLPEDSFRVSEALGNFGRVGSRLEPGQRDVNSYRSVSEIERVVNPLLGVRSSSKSHSIDLPGVRVVGRDGPYVTVGVSDSGSLAALGEGTQWCTRGSYPECQAVDYLDKYGEIFIILQNGRPVVQFTPDYEQVMDVDDNKVTSRKLLSLIPAPKLDESSSGREVRAAVDFAVNVARGRLVEAEPFIMREPSAASAYALNVLKGRWPEAEPYIMRDAAGAAWYARDVLEERWREAEPFIMRDAGSAVIYAEEVLDDRWPEAEPFIMRDPKASVYYATEIINHGYRIAWVEGGSKRWREAEPYIMKSPADAVRYVVSIIGGRWPEAESFIMRDPRSARIYASSILKGRWPEAEPYIMKSPVNAYYYARYVLKSRWPEAEPYILQDGDDAYDYARYVLKSRWPEAEPIIKQDKYRWADYLEEFSS